MDFKYLVAENNNEAQRWELKLVIKQTHMVKILLPSVPVNIDGIASPVWSETHM